MNRTESRIPIEIETQEGKVAMFPNLLGAESFNSPQLHAVLMGMGFDPKLFAEIMTQKFTGWIGDPISMPYPPDHPVEDLVIRSAVTKEAKRIEVTRVIVYEPHTMKTRLRGRDGVSVGFEATLVLDGNMDYSVLHGFEGVAPGVYTSHDSQSLIRLNPGDLLIIQRPVARQIVRVNPGTKYLYLSDPWDSNDLPVDILF